MKKTLLEKALGEKLDKKAMSISIVLLVIMVFVIIGICLVYFILYERATGATIRISDKIDSLYIQENYLNFYLDDIFKKSANNFKFEEGVSVFIESFKNNLNDYKDKNGNYVVEDIMQVELQINEGNIVLTNDKLSLNLNLELGDDSEEGIVARYNYKKVFEKNF